MARKTIAPARDRWSLDNPNDGYATIDNAGIINSRSFTQTIEQLKAMPAVRVGILRIVRVRLQRME